MSRTNKIGAWTGSLLLLAAASLPAATVVVDFDDLVLAEESYFRAGASTTFTSRGVTFFYEAPFGDCCWSGFTYSNLSDTSTPGFLNDGSAITGTGVGDGQDNYAVAFGNGARLEFATPQIPLGAFFTNTTYSFLAMRDGDDGNQTPFVKGPFGPDDFFTVIVDGLNGDGMVVGSVEVPLAVGTDIVDAWLWYDLSGLGSIIAMEFRFESSDVGPFGVNTPTFFAMDELTIVPIPAAAWLFGTALLLFGRMGRVRAAAS